MVGRHWSVTTKARRRHEGHEGTGKKEIGGCDGDEGEGALRSARNRNRNRLLSGRLPGNGREDAITSKSKSRPQDPISFIPRRIPLSPSSPSLRGKALTFPEHLRAGYPNTQLWKSQNDTSHSLHRSASG